MRTRPFRQQIFLGLFHPSKVLFSTFKGTYPSKQRFSMGKRGAPQEREDGCSGGLLPIALKIGEERGEENNPKLPLDRDEIIKQYEPEGSIEGKGYYAALHWFGTSAPSLFANNLLLSATVLFHIKISKTITSCIGIGGSTRCDEFSIVLLKCMEKITNGRCQGRLN